MDKYPPTIDNLKELKVFTFNGGRLTGEIPSEIGNLTNLTSLNLSWQKLGCYDYNFECDEQGYWDLCCITHCDHTNACNGGIPPEIGNLTKLTELNLIKTKLTGEIPSTIENLINLNTLNISHNRIGGTIPSSIGALVNLHSLTLKGIFTGSIPSEIGNLTNLTILSLDGFLSGSIPSEIGNLTNLSTLWLFSNRLTGTIPSEIANLINLTGLDLRNNQLGCYEYDYSNDPYGDNPDQNCIIHCDDINQCNGEIPQEIGNLLNLDRLHLEHNMLSGNIPENICNLSIDWGAEYFGEQYQFDISNNRLCPIYPSCIEDYVGTQDTSNCPDD